MNTQESVSITWSVPPKIDMTRISRCALNVAECTECTAVQWYLRHKCSSSAPGQSITSSHFCSARMHVPSLQTKSSLWHFSGTGAIKEGTRGRIKKPGEIMHREKGAHEMKEPDAVQVRIGWQTCRNSTSREKKGNHNLRQSNSSIWSWQSKRPSHRLDKSIHRKVSQENSPSRHSLIPKKSRTDKQKKQGH